MVEILAKISKPLEFWGFWNYGTEKFGQAEMRNSVWNNLKFSQYYIYWTYT